MAGLEVDRKQVMILIIITALAAGGGFWYFWHSKQAAQVGTLTTTLDSLNRQVSIARRDLARGTVEDLRRTITEYQSSLVLMRQLVPGTNEVPTLMDDIRARAGRRGVRIAEFAPQSVEPGDPFDTHRFHMQVFGHFDQIGEFLTDIASLRRIMVPVGLSLDTATTSNQTAYGDTLGGLLDASFQIRTFVKSGASANDGQ